MKTLMNALAKKKIFNFEIKKKKILIHFLTFILSLNHIIFLKQNSI